MKILGIQVVLLVAVGILSGYKAPLSEEYINVRISGLSDIRGQIVVAVFNSEESFLKEVFWSSEYAPKDLGPFEVQLPLPLSGEYAISIIHDKNSNGRLDTNFIGIPKEPFGFSNNPKLRLGPPSFSDVKFAYNGGETIDISLTSYRD